MQTFDIPKKFERTLISVKFCEKNSDCRAFRLLETVPAAIAFSKSSVFNLFSIFRVLKLILKIRFQNFQNKSSFIQRGEDRALREFCDPLVSKYDSCLTVQEHRLALCWLENFDCYISRDTGKFIHDLSRNRL